MRGDLILVGVLGLLGTGSAFGYLLKSRIDDRRSEKSWRRLYYLEDLKRQRELLLEFLGTPRADFTVLHGVGQTWDEQWRRDKASSVSEWVERNRPFFPKDIQRDLTYLSNIGGTMVLNQTMGAAQRPEAFERAREAIDEIESYVQEIAAKLGEPEL